ncbi:protein Wnt-8a [Nephila pilipes]|uniref:Protein Wnt n=1 Tax=Nephila pilipes TaxID=299642 RepID=A0A8X6K1X5_NEPPI|nr:protein Wnt-8a [Nephila pilipes]
MEMFSASFHQKLTEANSSFQATDTYAQSVVISVERGMEECKHQFLWEPWGCPKSSFSIFSRSNKNPATKEMAFLHAMISSSIVITLTRNCSQGDFKSCGCDVSKKGGMAGYKGWHWGGCSDHVKIGNRMAKHFLDNKENGRDIRALINLHNNRVGRMVVKKNMRRMCKCHGVSGSCEMQTCWMRVQDIRTIGDRLKEAYNNAQLFSSNSNGYNIPTIQMRRLDNSIPQLQTPEKLKIPKQQLAYLDLSPNYCIANESLGIPGTIGRICSKEDGKRISKAEKKSCRTLCRKCGHRVSIKNTVIERTCKCKFHWCCNVKCKTCVDQVTQYTCAAREH